MGLFGDLVLKPAQAGLVLFYVGCVSGFSSLMSFKGSFLVMFVHFLHIF
jgi:hypothetical protein